MAFDFMMDAPEPTPERYRFLQEENLRLQKELDEAKRALKTLEDEIVEFGGI